MIEFNGRGTSAAGKFKFLLYFTENTSVKFFAELAATEAWKEADAIVAGLSANELTPSN